MSLANTMKAEAERLGVAVEQMYAVCLAAADYTRGPAFAARIRGLAQRVRQEARTHKYAVAAMLANRQLLGELDPGMGSQPPPETHIG